MSLAHRLVVSVFAAIAVLGASQAHALIFTCGDSGPQCDGNCPAGTDCRFVGDNEIDVKQGGGAGDPNDPVPVECLCLDVGACCRADGSCTEGTEQECDGSYQGDGTTCELAECPTPPDSGYEVTECADPFEDISGTGTDLGFGDDNGAVVPIGFSFAFFGFPHANIGVSSNGYLSFGGSLTDFSNDPIPNTDTPNDLIAPLWDDFNPAAAGTVYRQTLGSAPNSRFIAQWDGVPQFGGGDSNTFQAVLYEGTNVIQFRYGTFTPEGFANDYSVGIENPTGTAGVSVSAATLLPGDCVQFSTDLQPVAPVQAVPVMSYVALAAVALLLIGVAMGRLMRPRAAAD